MVRSFAQHRHQFCLRHPCAADAPGDGGAVTANVQGPRVAVEVGVPWTVDEYLLIMAVVDVTVIGGANHG